MEKFEAEAELILALTEWWEVYNMEKIQVDCDHVFLKESIEWGKRNGLSMLICPGCDAHVDIKVLESTNV